MSTTKNLFLIHGAWNTHNSFNHIIYKLFQNKFPIDNITCFDYCCGTNPSLYPIVDEAKFRLYDVMKNNLPTVVIGHSMGGLIALKLHDHPAISEIITIASPLSGLHLNMFTQYYLTYHSPVMSDVSYRSRFIREIKLTNYTKPVKVLVAAQGFNPLITEPNDGVISVATQKKWVPSTATVHEIASNHAEILQVQDTVDHIENSLKG